MRLIRTGLSIAALVFTTTVSAQTYEIDNQHSFLTWTGAKVIGNEHNGTITIKSGEITYDKKGPATAVIVVDMKSISNTDLKEAEWNKKLVDHLKSDDFFSVEKFPEAKLSIKKITKDEKDKYKLAGDLTIKGIVKPVTLDATVLYEKDKISKIIGNLEFDRTDFDVRYGSGKFFQNLGDKMIADKVKVKVELRGKPTTGLGSI